MSRIYAFIRKEPVLIIAFLAALLSMLANPPSAEYLEFIDLRVLCLLFSLMAVIAGLQACNLFDMLARKLLAGKKRIRTVVLILVLMTFFSAMLVTNDVALITFVPFAILVMGAIGRMDLLIWVVVMQTLAANLGSMATPVGNPQNLFLYARYGLSGGDFFGLMLPLAALSLVLIFLLGLRVPRQEIRVEFDEKAAIKSPWRLGLYGGLFVLCLLSVFQVLHYGILTGLIVLALLISDRRLLLKVDYCLLLTFVCFFIFAGNIGAVDSVRELLSGLLEKNALLTTAAASQVISNVPAAVLLAGFTEDWRGLLAGSNIGGMGTVIASLASLISYKIYAASPGAKGGRYIAVFTLVNVIGLAILLPVSLLLL